MAVTVTRHVVVDASALLDALSASGLAGDRARVALRGARWSAPEHLRVEVFHGIRGRWLGGKLALPAAEAAWKRLTRVTVQTVPSALLLARMWELRDNVSGYDAAYVAAAERLGAPLVTADRRLTVASGIRCDFVLTSARAASG